MAHNMIAQVPSIEVLDGKAISEEYQKMSTIVGERALCRPAMRTHPFLECADLRRQFWDFRRSRDPRRSQ
jgi:hypothetical protein